MNKLYHYNDCGLNLSCNLKSLKEGDRIGLVTPSSPISKEDLQVAIRNIENLGFVPVIGENTLARERFLAGEDENRAKDINSFFADDNISAIMATRGGYGSGRLLKLLDYELIAKNPKLFIGHSDVTVLQNAILAKTGIPSLTGFYGRLAPDENAFNYLKQALTQDTLSFTGLETIGNNKAEERGVLIGGCLSLIQTLIGTEYMPSLKDAVLLLEDVGEVPAKVDRMLHHLLNAGVFDELAGVVFGCFYECVSKNEEDGTIEQVIDEFAKNLSIPMLKGLCYGHRPSSIVLPIGGHVSINAKEGWLQIKL